MKKPTGVPFSVVGWWILLLWLEGTKNIVDGFTPLRFVVDPNRSSRRSLRNDIASCRPSVFRTGSNMASSPGKQRVFTLPSTTTTKLGLTLVLPLPLPTTPRLSGSVIRIAESWAPSIGVLTSTLLYLAPAKAVWNAIRRSRNQGVEDDDDDNDVNGDDRSNKDDPMYGLNPLPIAIMPSVALSWLAYGLASSDPYLILGNLPGTLLSVAYLIGILPLMNYNSTIFPTLPNLGNDNRRIENTSSGDKIIMNPTDTDPQKRRRKPKKSKLLILTQATVLLSTATTLALWAILGLMTAGATDGLFHIGGLEFGMGLSSAARSGVIGEALGVYAASLFIVLSGSPLSMIRTVLRTKNSRTILGRLTAAQCVNTGLWTAYGLAVNDHFVWGPNIIVSTEHDTV